MSRFFSSKYAALEPYVPGEQPRDRSYIKLNTNESPFPPAPSVRDAVSASVERLQLYSDPECRALCEAFASRIGVEPEEVIPTNGSDEILNFAFMAFCDAEHPAAFPDITYGFYPVFADLNGVPYTEIPLRDDFTIDVNDYLGIGRTIFIANPNAPTGLALGLDEIERILRSNPDNVVVIDEAYVDFGGESCVPLIRRYDNLLVTQTFSKSRSMAGARLGFGIGSKALIADLKAIKYSTNPFNVNAMTMAAGLATLADDDYTRRNCATIIETRERTAERLRDLGFEVTNSETNFVFARHPSVSGEILNRKLRERGILVRRFGSNPRISEYNRITVGTAEQMDTLLAAVAEILEEEL